MKKESMKKTQSCTRRRGGAKQAAPDYSQIVRRSVMIEHQYFFYKPTWLMFTTQIDAQAYIDWLAARAHGDACDQTLDELSMCCLALLIAKTNELCCVSRIVQWVADAHLFDSATTTDQVEGALQILLGEGWATESRRDHKDNVWGVAGKGRQHYRVIGCPRIG